MSERVGHFDICKAMTAEDLDIRIAPLDNVISLHKVKAGTQVTIGVAGDVVAAIGIENKFVGGLLLCDREQYFATKQALESAVPERCGECGGKGDLVNDGPYSVCGDCGGSGVKRDAAPVCPICQTTGCGYGECGLSVVVEAQRNMLRDLTTLRPASEWKESDVDVIWWFKDSSGNWRSGWIVGDESTPRAPFTHWSYKPVVQEGKAEGR